MAMLTDRRIKAKCEIDYKQRPQAPPTPCGQSQEKELRQKFQKILENLRIDFFSDFPFPIIRYKSRSSSSEIHIFGYTDPFFMQFFIIILSSPTESQKILP